MKKRRYIVEFNRLSTSSQDKAYRHFQQLGYDCEKFGHKTTLIFKMTLAELQKFYKFAKRLMTYRTSSIIIHSNSGKAFHCRNSGNNPRRFVTID